MKIDKNKFLIRNSQDTLFFGFVSGILKIAPVTIEKAILNYLSFVGDEDEKYENINTLKSKFNRMRDEYINLNKN